MVLTANDHASNSEGPDGSSRDGTGSTHETPGPRVKKKQRLTLYENPNCDAQSDTSAQSRVTESRLSDETTLSVEQRNALIEAYRDNSLSKLSEDTLVNLPLHTINEPGVRAAVKWVQDVLKERRHERISRSDSLEELQEQSSLESGDSSQRHPPRRNPPKGATESRQIWSSKSDP